MNFMKKNILLAFIALFLLLQDQNPLAGNNIIFSISDFKSKKTDSGYEFIFNINHADAKKEYFDDSKVVISTEKYRISGIADNGILNENDLLFSRASFDFDGDDKYESDIKIENLEGSLFFNKKKIDQIISKKNYGNFIISEYLDDGKIKTYKINDSALSFILYNYDFKTNFITIGIGDKQNPVSLEYFQNPCVEVIIAQETDSFSKTPSCSINGNSVRTRFSNELIFSGQEWIISEAWAAVPFQPGKSGKEPIRISISNIKKPFAVILSVKFSLKEGTTLSTKRLINIID